MTSPQPQTESQKEPQTDAGLTSRDTGRSTYVPVRTLVKHLKNQDRRLQELYRKQADASASSPEEERARLLYGYAAEREQGLANYLDRLSDEERERILDTWLQYGDPSEYDQRVDAMLEEPPLESREAQPRLTELDRQLASVYERLENMAEVPNVEKFFRQLREVIEQRAQEHAEQVQRIEEL